jgi:hypothetical protein
MMRADLWAASRDGLDEEEGCSARLEAVVGTPKLVLDSVIFLDGKYRLGKIWPAALLADTISLSLSTGTCTSHIQTESTSDFESTLVCSVVLCPLKEISVV